MIWQQPLSDGDGRAGAQQSDRIVTLDGDGKTLGLAPSPMRAMLPVTP